jgi:hypothetical protein
MKDKILSLIIFFSLLFSFTGCGTLSKIFHKTDKENTETTFGTTQNMYQVTHEYTMYQIDSMCVADMLPMKFEGWTCRTYTDYETNQYIVRYMYVKELNDNYEMIYIITPRGDIYVVSKRKVVSE